MRIGIDVRLAHWPGIGRYIEEIVRRLAIDFPDAEYVLIDRPHGRPPETKMRYHDPALRERLCSRNIRFVDFAARLFSVGEPFALGRLVDSERLDLLHSPYINVPLLSRVPLVTTLHDFRHPDVATSWDSLRTLLKRGYYECMLRIALARSRAAVCVSAFLAREIEHFDPNIKRKLVVIRHGVSEAFAPLEPKTLKSALADEFGVQEPYFVFVGTLKPHKNVVPAIDAFALARKSLPGDYRFLIAAEEDARYPEARARVGELHLEKTVRFVGHVPKDKLRVLYCGARATVLPSSYESFGLPVLESMACGTPVIASPSGALPEVAGDCAYYTPPRPVMLASAMLALARDDALFSHLRAKGLQRAAAHTWAHTTKALHSLYCNVVAGTQAS